MNAFAVNLGQEYGVSTKFSSFGSFLSTIIFNIYGLAGIILLFLLIFGGASVIIGAGGGDSDKTQKGAKAIGGAVVGFVIIFAAYWIVQIIETITGVKIFNPNF